MSHSISCVNRFSPEHYIEGIKANKVVMAALSVIALGILGGGVTVCYLTPSFGWDCAIFGLSGITFASAIAIPLFSVPTKKAEPSESPSPNVEGAEIQAAEDVFATWDARDLLPQILSYLSPQDLARAARVSRHWYNTINREGSETKLHLDRAYECFLLRKVMPEALREVMGNLEDIPTISDIQENPSVHENPEDYHSDILGLLFPVFERENSAILKGQDNQGNWFFVIRYEEEHMEGILEIFQKDKDDLTEWDARTYHRWKNKDELDEDEKELIQMCGSPLSHDFQFEKDKMTFCTWLQKLLNKQICGDIIHRNFTYANNRMTSGEIIENNGRIISLWQPL